MGRRLHRREMLGVLLGAPLAAAITACEKEPTPPRPISGELLGQNHKLGHRLRGARPSEDDFARAPLRKHQVIVVGSGPAGLTAAYRLQRAGIEDVKVLELENAAGGTSRSGRSKATGYPWGAHYITCPSPNNADLVTLLREMDVVHEDPETGAVKGRDPYLVAEPKERLYDRGYFYSGLYRQVGADAADLAEAARFEAIVEDYAKLRDGQGRPAFTLPRVQASGDVGLAELDLVSAEQFLQQQGFTSERLRWMLRYACRDDYGLELEQTSAWALLFYFAARLDDRGRSAPVLTWPEGNGALVNHLMRGLSSPPVLGELVLDVVDRGAHVDVHVVDAGGALLRYRASRVIVATPQFIARRIVRRLRDERPGPELAYGPWLVANLHVRSRPQQRGAVQAWDTVLRDSPSLGYVTATHQRGRDFGPSVLTYYLPLTDETPPQGRKRMLSLDLSETQESILSDLSRAHPDLREHLERLDVFRWGHAMVQPRVGTLFDPKLLAARKPFGRVHFAHSDLSGMALFEEAFAHGNRAAHEVLKAEAWDAG